jgi:hypothetical protein
VPEASVDEYGDADAREDDVGTNSDLARSDREVAPETQSSAMERRREKALWARTCSTITTHRRCRRRARRYRIWQLHEGDQSASCGAYVWLAQHS